MTNLGKFGVEYAVYEKGRKAPQWTLEGDLNGEMTLEDLLAFTKQNLILIADQALREEQAKGFDKEPVVTVDGRNNKSPADVNPLGSIVFTSRKNISDILLAIYDALEHRSPVKTGLYKRSNYVFFNGDQIANDRPSLERWVARDLEVRTNDVIRFVNIQPYARKLERYGVTAQKKRYRTKKSSDPKGRSGAGGMVLAPNGTYFLAARSASRLFKNNLKIGFKFIPGSLIGLRATFKNSSGIPGRARRQKSSPRSYLYPSIVLKINDGGLL